MKKRLLYTLLAFLQFTVARAFNIEVSVNWPLSISNATTGSNAVNATPTYAGYNVIVSAERDEINLIIGEPHYGMTGSLISCNLTYLKYVEMTTTSAGIETTASSINSTSNVTNNTTSDIGITSASTDEASTNISTTPSPTQVTSSGMNTATMSTNTTSADFSELSCKRLDIKDKTQKGNEGDNHNFKTDSFGSAVVRNNGTLAVCSPTRQQQCPNSYFVPGACYVGDPTIDEWEFMQWNETRCFDKKIAVIFVVDGSMSIGINNFQEVRKWLISASELLLQTFGDAVLIEVLQYSAADNPFIAPTIDKSEVFEIPFKFGDCEDIECIRTGVNNMPYLSHQTFTHYALRRTREVELKRPIVKDSEKIIVVLTDGAATDPELLDQWYNEATADGIIVFAVGVTSDIKVEELRTIANGGISDERVSTVDDFSDLSTILSSLTNEISSSALEGGTDVIAAPISNAQHGFSIDFGIMNDTQNEFLLLGAPGAYDWSGAVTKYDSISDTTADIPTYEDVQGVLPNRTKESYMGYTLTTGFFEGPRAGEFAATGAPRYMLKGAVVVFKPEKDSAKFNQPHRIMANEANSQLGSYFGGSLLSVDINGDDIDDLFIGAPLYSGVTHDEGRVYVYVSKPGGRTLSSWTDSSYEPLVLDGMRLIGGRFGTAIASAGDLNNDKMNDVIIGAPMTEGDRGAIFIYHGKKNGFDTNLKQMILASELTGVNLKYFGQSIQGGVDLDGNLYPDVAVGAPKSDTVVIFRSRAVVEIIATVTFLQSKIDIFNCIDNNYVNCTSVQVCFTAQGRSIESVIGLTYNLTLDSGKQSLGEKRLEFRDALSPTGVTTIRQDLPLKSKTRTCVTRGVNVKANIKDYDTTVNVTVTYDLQASHTDQALSSIRDPTAPNTATDSLVFDKNCGVEGQCQYDLKLSGSLLLPPATLTGGEDLTNGGKILIVSDQTDINRVIVKLNLTNKGQNAFGTQVKVDYTSELSWSRIEKRQGVPATNSCIEALGQPVDMGNGLLRQILQYNYRTSIMQQNSWCYFEISFLTRNLRNNGKLDSLNIDVNAFSSDTTNSSIEVNPSDNSWRQTRLIKYRSDFTVEEQSTDPDIQYNFTNTERNITSVKQIGQNTSDVVINYKIRGTGYSNIPTVTIRLIWPSKTAANYSLLYLHSVACNTKYTTANPEKGDNNLLSCNCEMDKVNIYNLSTDAPNENNTGGARFITEPATVYLDQKEYNCFSQEGNHTCETMTCNINNLGSSTEVNFIALFRLVTSTFNLTNTSNSDTNLISRFEAFETSPIILNKAGKNNSFANPASRVARKYTEPIIVVPVNNIWIYILAAVGGLLLLIAIAAILWKVGFFKSKYADMKKDAQDDMDDAADFPGPNNGGSTADIVDN